MFFISGSLQLKVANLYLLQSRNLNSLYAMFRA
nr:MAG TPA: hypothetical protein [Caudoviricetes sp.]